MSNFQLISCFNLNDSQTEQLKDVMIQQSEWETTPDQVEILLRSDLKVKYDTGGRGTAIELRAVPTNDKTIVAYMRLNKLFPDKFPTGANGYLPLPQDQLDWSDTGREDIRSVADLDAHYKDMYEHLSDTEWQTKAPKLEKELLDKGTNLASMGATSMTKPSYKIENEVGLFTWNNLGLKGVKGSNGLPTFGFPRLEMTGAPGVFAIEKVESAGGRAYYKVTAYTYSSHFKVVCKGNSEPAKKVDISFLGDATVVKGALNLKSPNTIPTSLSV
jgi:hypothetical protein